MALTRPISKEASERIRALQFVLMLLIIVIHAERGVNYYCQTDWNAKFVITLLSSQLCRIAVPLYFMFSCYLTVNKEIGSVKEYLDFVFNRFLRLMVPYFIFNGLAILLASYLAINIPGSGRIDDLSNTNIMGRFIESYNFPLWFLRNLFLLFLFFPVFQYSLKKIPILSLTFLVLLNLFYPISHSYFISEFCLFFYLGGVLRYKQIDLELLDRWKFILGTFYLLGICTAAYFLTDGSLFRNYDSLPVAFYHKMGRLMLIFLGIGAIWSLFSLNYLKNNKILVFLSPLSFFIFLNHEPLLSFVQQYLRYLYGLGNYKRQLISYFGGVGIVVLILIPVAIIFRKYFNAVYRFICGESKMKSIESKS